MKAEAKTLSLPYITASVEAGKTEASSRFEVVGMSSKKITEALPSSEALRLDMESYIRLQDAFDAIKGLIWEEGNTIHPQVLAVFGDIGDYTGEDYEQALAIGWALTRIKERKTHGDTQDEYKEGSTRFNEIVKGIYTNLLGADYFATKPSEEVKRKAETLLLGFKVER
jgi:hypothetical protein